MSKALFYALGGLAFAGLLFAVISAVTNPLNAIAFALIALVCVEMTK